MYDWITRKIPPDRDLPERSYRLEWLRKVLNGTLYDHMLYEFHQERQNADGTGDYIPICDRKPSVRSNLCGTVVEDSVGLLFGEGRFPDIDCEDEVTRQGLRDVVKECALNAVMIDAGRRGSIGSVMIRMRVLLGRLFFDAIDTCYLTPEWRPDAPDTLLRVTERRKVPGRALRDQGYDIDDNYLSTMFWFVRQWDEQDEVWFQPVPVSARTQPTARDDSRSVRHRLGFVPLVWIRNLPGGDEIDGACTFRPAIHSQIEIEYQLSQGGRGLKYSSDPTLLIKEPASPDGTMVRSASSAIVVSAEGDAKMLEIGGTAVAAVIEYARALREMALENIHGNRANADKVSAAQSGKALELLHQPLVSLADKLRIGYGEFGLLKLLKMVIAASSAYPIAVNGKPLGNLSTDKPLTLKWPPFFSPTFNDQVEQATALGLAIQGGFMSPEAALKNWAPTVDIEDTQAEMAAIAAHQQNQADQQLKLKAAIPRDPGQGSPA